MRKPVAPKLDPFRKVLACCPDCVNNQEQITDPGCPVCHGEGVIRLGAAALSIYDANTAIVAAGIRIYLEEAIGAQDDAALAEKVDDLCWAGIMHRPRNLLETPRIDTDAVPAGVPVV